MEGSAVFAVQKGTNDVYVNDIYLQEAGLLMQIIVNPTVPLAVGTYPIASYRAKTGEVNLYAPNVRAPTVSLGDIYLSPIFVKQDSLTITLSNFQMCAGTFEMSLGVNTDRGLLEDAKTVQIKGEFSASRIGETP